ncbi:MAG: hypothetical protein RR842_12355, partial [Gordonibacter sp.]|uniref:hypothetical protein n=1 Tax=Gordonibacter sp. TaxID=1968902 RepID=UPI002FCA67B7
MSSINEWTYLDKEKEWNDLFTRVSGSSLRAFPIGVFPWKKISKVDVMTFNSCLEPSNFSRNWSGFNPIKETKYLACDVGETSLDLETLPLNYVYDNFLKLDIDNTDNVIEFIKNYGMPYCPYFDC